MKNKYLLILMPVVLVIAVVVLLPLFLDKETILKLASDTIKKQTGATLEVAGPVDLALFPRIGIALEDASLTMPGESEPSLEVQSLQLGMRLIPLFTGKVELESLRVHGLHSRIPPAPKTAAIDTSDMTDDELDDYYARRRETQAEAGAAAAGNALALPLALKVKALDVTNSQVELLGDESTPATTINIQSFLAKNLNLDTQPIELQAGVDIVGEQVMTVQLDGRVRFDEARQLLLLDELEVGVSGITQAPVMLETEGTVNISRQIADIKLKLQNGESVGTGSLRYASFESPKIDAVLHFNRLNPGLILIAGPEAASASQPESAGGDDPLPLQALRGLDTRARLTVDEVVVDKHTLSNVEATLRAIEGVIRIKPMTAQIYEGKIAMQATFNGKHNTAILNTRGSLENLNIAAALAAVQEEPAATGKANLSWKLVGRGRTQNELVAAIKGPITLATSDTVLQNIGIESMLCQAVALTNQESLTTSFPSNTAFTTLGADIQIADGQATLAPLSADLAHVSLKGNGVYNFLSRDFDLTLKAKLSPELETLDKACRVSKRLTAIDWPVDCKGNADGEPASWCKVDTQEIIEDLTKNEAERQIKKNAGKLLDKLFN